MPYSEMPRFMNGLDALVLPSLETAQWKELFGRVLIEAMACGVPVIASATGGIPDVVGDAGILVRPGDIAGLAEGLQEIVGDPARRAELGEKGRKRTITLFDVRRVGRMLANDIEAVLGGSRPVDSVR
jgi:glycosyltransferase involved in cell wall biosynthesis